MLVHSTLLCIRAFCLTWVLSSLQTVKHMWPFICQFIEKLFRETIEPAVRGANTHLSTFSFTKVDVGQQVSFFLNIIGACGKIGVKTLKNIWNDFTLLSREKIAAGEGLAGCLCSWSQFCLLGITLPLSVPLCVTLCVPLWSSTHSVSRLVSFSYQPVFLPLHPSVRIFLCTVFHSLSSWGLICESILKV